MEKDLNRLKTITDRFSKIGSKPELIKTDIVTLIKNSTKYLKSRMPIKTEFIIDLPTKKILIPINTILLNWVIENLVKNAVDSMKGKGRITINLKEEANDIFLNISDTGEGVERTMIKSIFNPGVTSKKRGWGLGLSLAKRIVEQYHNGNIFVLQSEKGIGSTFTIKLPKN